MGPSGLTLRFGDKFGPEGEKWEATLCKFLVSLAGSISCDGNTKSCGSSEGEEVFNMLSL